MNMSLKLRSIRPVRMTIITHRKTCKRKNFLGALILVLIGLVEIRGWSADSPVTQNVGAPSPIAASTDDPLLNLFIEKGYVTQEEAAKVKAEAEAQRTNSQAISQASLSKWKISEGTKQLELFGDIRVRYEDRKATDPADNNINLQRERYSIRFGLRGTLLDDFYYGMQLQTGTSARSAWVTAGTSASGGAYNGPYGNSTATISIGQAYMGWREGTWLDITLGKMPNPLYTTTMVWSGNINPEGAAEHFKYTVGNADFFATFGQFVYQDNQPNDAAGGLGINGNRIGQTVPNLYQIAWQGGLTYHITDKLSAKAAATIYEYFGLQRSSILFRHFNSPYFGDPYVGEGALLLCGWIQSRLRPRLSGYSPGAGRTSYNFNNGGYGSVSYPFNQVGLNDLFVVEVPFEIDYKFKKLQARIFGDVAYNLDGEQRAQDAATAYSTIFQANPTPPLLSTILFRRRPRM